MSEVSRGICYREDSNVTILVVCTGEDVRLFEYPANLDKVRRLFFATGPKLEMHWR
jgi:hypothetical protein